MKIEDLPPRMRKQALKQIAEQERDKRNSIMPEESPKQSEMQSGRSKYKAVKKTVTLPDGTEHTFDSAKEFRVYDDMLIRLKAKEISNLRLQVPYELIPKQLLSTGKTERSVCLLMRNTDSQQHVRRIKRCRGTSRTCGSADSLHIKPEQHALTLNKLKADIHKSGQTVCGMSVKLGIRDL